MNSFPLPSLSSLPCIVRGDWTSSERALWKGKVECEQAVVCTDFLVSEGNAHWSKAARLQPKSDVIRLALGVSPTDPGHVTIAGNSIGLPARLSRPGARPDIPTAVELRTGHLGKICRFESAPTIEIFVLILAASDVHWGRNQLWRLRSPLAPLVGEPFGSILTDGRSGKCKWNIAHPGIA